MSSTLEGSVASPPRWHEIAMRTIEAGFDMSSEARIGEMLRMLAVGRKALLEMGTGTGLATAWLLDGMDEDARLATVDNDPEVQAVARDVLGEDPRVDFVTEDGAAYLAGQNDGGFDLIFADAVPGKYESLDDALRLLQVGGIYVVDDMSPQPNWPEGHQARVDDLVLRLASDPRLAIVGMDWASGVLVAAKRAA
ncbi:SAM-dependent methyltransferase [Caulobacter sp. D4A]|uniref:O-methyltransferase n=1 Tax=unclassified Caulobacter TaxID=2648921 RepID=UPI000D732DDF|nr:MULTISPECIES: class I SAM-dependent methyltransferase [unclassified Caulobacter]PXA86688.1 SAM-dependent methyltransferase [Caulobacter sp. D4A]PXA88517.1 SAM-dependent methyltransferase [Caulobacter sp. D5]